MKIGIFGDLQLTHKAPQRRVDSYFQTQLRKLSQTLSIFEENECDCVVQPGDFFDTPAVSCQVKANIISLFKVYSKDFNKIYCCWGQHDVIGHSKTTLLNSPLAVLEAAGVVKILNSEPVVVGKVSKDDGTRVYLYGAGFGEDIPEPYEDCYNILVVHKMIGDKFLWPGQEIVGPRQFLRKYSNFNLVVCGDYHYRFYERWNGRTILNMGALVRKTCSENDLKHKPAVGVFDTSNDSLVVHELNIEPVEKVFDFSQEVKGKDDSARKELLAKLVEKLKQGSGKLLEWKQVLVRVLEEKKSSLEVRRAIDKVLEEVENGK